MHTESHCEINSINQSPHLRRMRVSVIREEFLDLTGHPYKAILLNQLYYWTQKVKDFDEMLQEEKTRDYENESYELRHGWIYKSAPDFLRETLLTVSKYTFYRHMDYLIEKGWVETKSHPTHAWDKTTFYRLNLEKIYHDLQLLGYELPAVFQDTYQKMAQTFMLHSETSMLQIATHNKITDKDDVIEIDNSIPNKYIQKSVRACARNINEFESQGQKTDLDVKRFIQIWHDVIKKEYSLSKDREENLRDILHEFFHNDEEEWIEFCDKIKNNDFLMGDNDSKWCISLDWASQKKNVVKILKRFKEKTLLEEPVLLKKNDILEKEAFHHIEGIKDPIWKTVCQEIFKNWAPGANVPYSSPYFEGLYKKKGQTRADIETFLNARLWEAKLGSVSDKVALLWVPMELEFFFKTYYQESSLRILTSIYENVRRLTWTTDKKRFDEHWKYFEEREGEKRRD